MDLKYIIQWHAYFKHPWIKNWECFQEGKKFLHGAKSYQAKKYLELFHLQTGHKRYLQILLLQLLSYSFFPSIFSKDTHLTCKTWQTLRLLIYQPLMSVVWKILHPLKEYQNYFSGLNQTTWLWRKISAVNKESYISGLPVIFSLLKFHSYVVEIRQNLLPKLCSNTLWMELK